MTALANAHIEGQRRLRELAGRGISTIWRELPGYDEDDVDRFLARAVPFVLAAQRQSITLTEAFLARELGRRAIGLDPASIIGPGIRNGTPPEQVYRRPFVTVWTALGASRAWQDAVNEGLARAVSTAQTDVQLAMRQTLRDVAQADDRILGYARVPDGNACDFCRLVAGQRYTTEDLMPIHNHCGCGVDVITAFNRSDFTGKRDNDLDLPNAVPVEIAQHGELGPVLVNGDHTFTTAEEAL